MDTFLNGLDDHFRKKGTNYNYHSRLPPLVPRPQPDKAHARQVKPSGNEAILPRNPPPLHQVHGLNDRSSLREPDLQN